MRDISEIKNIAIDKSYSNIPKAILAGLLISIGAMFMLNVNSSGLVNGFVFSIALILIVFTNSNLFTGQCLYQQFSYSKYKDMKFLTQNLTTSWLGNFIGCFISAIFYIVSIPAISAKTFLEVIIANKVSLPVYALISRGAFCNILVCLALFVCLRRKDNISKIIAIMLCIAAFISCGFEHSVANMFLLSAGYLLNMISMSQELYNLLYVTIGNMIGAWIVYLFIKE